VSGAKPPEAAYPAPPEAAYPALPEAADLDDRHLVMAEILEAGGRSELARLAREFGREAIAAFVGERGGRKLSARSRRFWSRALGIPEPTPHPLAEQLWPLA
jgi:hypothetical protein